MSTSAGDPATAPRSARRKRLAKRIAFVAVGGVLTFFAVELIVGNFDEVLGAADLVSRPQLGWLAIAIAAEIASYMTYAAAEQVLLARQRRRVGLTRLSLLAIAAQALGVCIPGGYAWSNVLSFRVLRRWGVDAVASGGVLFVTVALYVAALGVLSVIGAQIAGDAGPVHDVRTVAYVVLAVTVVAVGVLLLRPSQVRRTTLAAVDALRRRVARHRAAAETLARLERGLGEARTFGRGPIVSASVWLMAAWIGDIVCLIASFEAVGTAPPWRGLLLAYCGAQLAALLPFTPGGLGVVEGSLTLALVSYGGGQEKTVAAVLLYRLISFWGLMPTGAACYAALSTRRLRASVVQPAPAPVGSGA